MRKGTHFVAILLAAAVSTLPGTIVQANAKGARKHAPVNLVTAPPGLLGFTPAAADPHLTASLSRGGNEKMFRFTPAGGAPGSRKSVTVAMRSRSVTKAEAAQTSVGGNETTASSSYSLGVSIGWSRFALSGGMNKVDTGLAPFGRESVDVGLSYLGRNWRTTLQLGSEHGSDSTTQTLGHDQSYSVDLGGAYALSHNLSLSGGLRYKRDEVSGLMADSKRDSQSVYVGTSFNF